MDIISNLVSIAPHITAMIAIIVPAIQSLQNKKYEIENNRQEWVTTQWTTAYFDFCACYVKFLSDGFNRSQGCELASHAYKLAAWCSTEGAERLNLFASYISSISSLEIDPYSCRHFFEECITIIRQELIEPSSLRQAIDQSSCRKPHVFRGSSKKR